MNSRAATRGQRALIDACLANGVPFFWQGPGTLLMARSGLNAVLGTVAAAGIEVLGLEGFELDPTIHPRLDLIFDAGARPGLSALEVAGEWPDDIWLHVTLGESSWNTS